MNEVADLMETAIPVTRHTDSIRQEWRIHCHDMLERDRSLTVLVDSHRVVLVGPPGETAVLSARQLSELRVALGEAAAQAER
ncbi:MAG: hypothetical protein ACRDRN_10980 [Sciscionella sp.]